MRRETVFGVVMVISAIVLSGAACGPASTPMGAPTPTSAPAQAAEEVLPQVTADLAERIGVSPEQIQIEKVEDAEWPSTALGCSRPDEAYAEVITPGYRVIVSFDGKEYEYHASKEGQYVLCGQEADVTVPKQARKALKSAKKDLAQRVGLNSDQIEVIAVESVQWRNSSLGCPEPGEAYLQVITPGYRIVLSVQGMRYEYHSDRNDTVVRCLEGKGADRIPRVETPARPGPVRVPVEVARKDLAGRVGIPVDVIEVVEVEKVTWRDASLACPEPGKMYAEVETPGFKVVLSAKGERYEYHTDERDRVVLCERSSREGSMSGENVPAEAEQVVRLAKELLAERVDAVPDVIEVARVETVEWRDASLGCPEPGKMYAQVITPGFRIDLVVDGETYEYHSDTKGHVIPCEKSGGAVDKGSER